MHAIGQPCPVGGEQQATECIDYMYIPGNGAEVGVSGMDGLHTVAYSSFSVGVG